MQQSPQSPICGFHLKVQNVDSQTLRRFNFIARCASCFCWFVGLPYVVSCAPSLWFLAITLNLPLFRLAITDRSPFTTLLSEIRTGWIQQRHLVRALNFPLQPMAGIRDHVQLPNFWVPGRVELTQTQYFLQVGLTSSCSWDNFPNMG
jgi:hypothetical protein